MLASIQTTLTSGSSDVGPANPSSGDKSKPGAKAARVRKAHKRSRTGCLVCRQRHKRCDEVFTDGTCQTCRASGYECVPPPADRRLKYSRQLAHNAALSSQSPPSPHKVPSPAAPLAASAIPQPQIVDPGPSRQVSQPDFLRDVNGELTASSTAVAEYIQSLFNTTYFETSNQNDATGVSSAAMASEPFPLFSPYPAPGQTHQSSTPFNSAGDSLAFLNVPDSDAAGRMLLPSFYAEEPGAAQDDSANPLDVLLSGSEASASPTAIPTRPHEPVDDPDLTAANQLITRTHPSPTYTKPTYELGSDGTVQWSQVGPLYKKYQESWHRNSPQHIEHPESAESALSPLRSTTQAAILEALSVRVGKKTTDQNQGTMYSNFALSLLGEPGKFSLNESLNAVCDLQTYNFVISGSAHSYAALLVGEAVVRGALGASPTLSLLETVRKNEMGTLCFAQGDLGHCLCEAGRLPIFALTGPSFASDVSGLADSVGGVTYTMPLVLQEITHAIIVASVTGQQIDFAAMETRIRALFDDEKIPKVWSRAVIIILYQRLKRAGPLHPVIRAMAWEILLELEPGPCRKHEVFPLFLAGAVAMLQVQRKAVRTRWVRAPEHGFEEAQAFLQLLWNEMDETGYAVDWLEFMSRHKIMLAFF